MHDDNIWTRVYEHDYKPLAVWLLYPYIPDTFALSY